MRVLVVSQWFPPEATGGPARFLESALVWQNCGHEVTVLAGLPNWPTGRIHDDYRWRLLVRESYGGVQVIRAPVIPARNTGVLRRLANHGSFVVSSSIIGLASRGRPDVVVATSPPMFAPLAGLTIARRYRVPFVLDVRDLWPDAIFTLSDIRPAFVKKWLESFERFLYRAADAVVVVTAGFAETVRQRGAQRVETITNGVDLNTFTPGPRDPEARGLLGGDGFVVFYGGTLGLAHGLRTAIDAAAQLADSPVRFVFVGEGADRPALEQLVAQRGLTNVSFLPKQPRERMPALYRAADLCLVSLRPAALFKVTIPSKIFEIMGTGRPILAAIEGEAADIVRSSGAGFVVEPGSPEALVDAIAKAQASERLEHMGMAGRRFVEERFDRGALALRYESLLRELTGGSRPAA